MKAISILCLTACTLHAQGAIKERTLGAPTAIDSEPFRNIASVRELSDGRLLVVERGPMNAIMQGIMADAARRMAANGRAGRGGRSATQDSARNTMLAQMSGAAAPGGTRREARVLIFDRALTHATTVGHAGSETGAYSQPETLIAGVADTTLLIDLGVSDIAVIDPSGAIVHPKTIPSVPGALLAVGGAASDRAGRLLYIPRQQVTRMTPAGMVVGAPDTAAIIAFDFKTGGTLPVAVVHEAPSAITMVRDTVRSGGMHMMSKSFPFPTIDDWVMMPDGTLAIIRGADLHIDWIAPNGKVRSTPPIPYIKNTVSDSDKVKFLESLHLTENIAGANPLMPPGMSITQINPDSFPAFKPPFSARGAKAASDGTIWLPAKTISPASSDGFYVIGLNGRIREHVHLMKGQHLLAFGKGVVYVEVNEGRQDNRVARVPLR
jgi:hypothetical protein